MRKPPISCAKTNWKKRPGLALNNGRLELTVLTGGGHLADLRLVGESAAAENAFWEAPWPGVDPDKFTTAAHGKKYGPPAVGRFLSSFTGHALCLDYFGGASTAEAAQGLALHGEAPNSRWKVLSRKQTPSEVFAKLGASLPAAGLKFQRELRLLRDESVIYVRETVTNLLQQDHFFHWAQHVTLGLPLLTPGQSSVSVSGSRAKTWPHGYEGASLVEDDREFTWPHAPATGGGTVDLGKPFARDGKGFVATVLVDPERHHGFVTGLNWESGLLLGYCFRRADFPWVAVWEENVTRSGPPWNGKTRARGMEFSSTPMPVGKEEAFRRGDLFGTSTFRKVGAKETLETSYLIFLTRVSRGWRGVRDIQTTNNAVVVLGSQPGERIELAARKLGDAGFKGEA